MRSVHWVVLSAERRARAGGAARARREFLAASRRREVVVEEFRDGFFPYIGGAVKDVLRGA